MLDRTSHTPPYLQLEAMLAAEAIAWSHPEQPFHSELALAARFGVSRMTARRALDGLVKRKLLRRERGRGSYVTGLRLVEALSPTLNVDRNWRAMGLDYKHEHTPAPTRDPRAIFAASRVTQAHPAPPAVAVERRVVSDPGFSRGRPGTPSGREALPGPQQRPEAPANVDTPRRGFATPGPEREAPPARPSVRAPLANVPQIPREPPERPTPSRNEGIVAPRQAAPTQPPVQQQEQAQREQLQREQAQRAQNAQRDQAARMQQDQARREQAQNEQAARAAQMQSQRAQESQRAQQQMRQAQESQRARQEQQQRQPQGEAQGQRPRPAQEQRGAQTPDNRARPQPAGEAQRPRREEKRPAQGN